ncbi:hypothetical protein F5887DRAFT_917388 [Amanita rubescens]|nr:hypothetical protein F5887DRAFT_917388 [Amanita rubescens]
MPFFEGAHNFRVHDNRMNDVAGDYKENGTQNTTNNADSNNRYSSSDVNRGNNVTNTNRIGDGDGDTISNANGPQTGGAVPVNPQNVARKPEYIVPLSICSIFLLPLSFVLLRFCGYTVALNPV